MAARRAFSGAIAGTLLAVLLWAAPASSITPPFLEGDANCDGVTNSIDALHILQVDAGLVETARCPDFADVNRDGAVNSLDAAIVLQLEAGLCCPILEAEVTIESLPSGVPFGEPVEFVLAITNPGVRPVTRKYSTGQIFEFRVADGVSQPLWSWSNDQAFTQAITHQTFAPGETKTHRIVWDQKNDSGERVLFGFYTVLATDVGCSQLPPRTCHLSAVARFEILPPPDRCSGDWLIAELDSPSDRLVVSVGEPVPLSITVTNCSDELVTRTYRSSQRYDFSVLDGDRGEVWHWSDDMAFTQAFSERVFQPGETVTYEASWNQKTYEGEPIGPGVYVLRATILGCHPLPRPQCYMMDELPIEIVP